MVRLCSSIAVTNLTPFRLALAAIAFVIFIETVDSSIVVGPLAGGVILEHYHWRMIFVFDLLFVGVTFPLVLRYVESRSGSGRRNFDLVGAAFFFASLLTFLLATSYNFGNMGNWVVPALYTVSGLSLALFIRQEFLCKYAVLNLSLFRDASLSVYLAARYLSFVVFGGIFLILPFYLENLLNFSPDTVGMLFAIQPLFFGTASWLSGKLTIRFGSRFLVICALTILATAYFWMSFLSSELILWQFASQMTILGIGSGLLNAPSNQLIFGSARPHNLSMISSLTALTRIHARSTGIAILGSLWGTLALARPRCPDWFGCVCQRANQQPGDSLLRWYFNSARSVIGVSSRNLVLRSSELT